MNNYTKAFIFSAVLHAVVVLAFIFGTKAMVRPPQPKIIIDLSHMLIESINSLDEEDTAEIAGEPTPPPPVEPVAPPPPQPPRVIETPPPALINEELPPLPVTPTHEEEPAYAFVDADETSVAMPDEYYGDYTSEEEGGGIEPEGINDTLAQYAAEQAAREGELRRSYVGANYNYIVNHIKRKLNYPQQAKRMGMRGVVTVAFTIHNDGSVSDLEVDESSGYELLDNAGIEAVTKAAPFPKPPVMARVAVPIEFKLR